MIRPLTMIAAMAILPLFSTTFAGELVVFGDSQSSVAPHQNFSNGPVWADYLADNLGLVRPIGSDGGGTNYAVGGSGTRAVGNQVTNFLAENVPQDDQLFVLWAGGIDMFNSVSGKSAAANMADNIEKLIQAGANNIVTGNLPDFSGISVVSGSSIQVFNDAMLDQVASLEEKYQMDIGLVDLFGIYEHVRTAPTAYGFPGFDESDSSARQAVWANGVHWSTQYHKLMATHVVDTLGLSGTRFVGGWATIDRDASWDDVNIAPSGTATQSSDHSDANIASKAIDGDLETFARTKTSETDRWWQVELESEMPLVGMRIYNTSGNGRNLTDRGGFRTQLLDDEATEVWKQDFVDTFLPYGVLEADFAPAGQSVQGQTLRLSKLSPDSRSFRLSEVEVYGNADELTLSPEDIWAFEIDAESESSDVLDVFGDLHVDGSKLSVSLMAGALEAGDSFDIIDAQNITGSFATLSLPTLPPDLQWFTDGLHVDGSLAVTIFGDCTGDGSLTSADVDCAAAGSDPAQFDIVLATTGSLLADLNFDGEVGFADFLRLSENFGRADNPAYSDGDLDWNGKIDFSDFLILSNQFGIRAETPQTAAVPEPSGAMCLAASLAIALMTLRKKSRNDSFLVRTGE